MTAAMWCLPAWLAVVVLLGAVALGFTAHFAWHWWLLSRPDADGSR